MEDIEKGSPANVRSRTSERDSPLDEEASDEEDLLPSTPVEAAARALQSAVSFDSPFDESHGCQEIGAGQPTISSNTTSEAQENNAAATPQSLKSPHVAKVPRFNTNTDCSGSDPGQSVIQNSTTIVAESLASTTGAVESTKNTNLSSSQTEGPPALPLKPATSPARAARSTKSSDAPSPQTILRALIRGAYREMMYFTLPHEIFSLDDLRQGLDYAFSLLQAAQSKLAILTVLNGDMADVSASHLRGWMTRIDRMDPQSCHEHQMFVVFESLSSGEIRVALSEVVQSRLIVDDELKRMKALLIKRLAELESNEKSSIWLVSGSDFVRSLQNEFAGTADGLLGEDEAKRDAVFTAVMVLVIGALYFCVR